MSPFRILDSLRSQWNWRHFAVAAGAAAAIWLVLFSSFFTNWSGPLDSVLTYLPWLKRAGGESPHLHPWYFYLHRLAWFHPAKSPVWSEGLILGLAIVGAAVSLTGKKSPLHRLIALYAIILTAIYSAISYKTPWCLLGFFHGLILLAGVGAATLLEWCRTRGLKVAVIAMLSALTLQLTWQSARANFTIERDPENRKSWRANFNLAADPRNPYVYAQTSPNLLELMKRVEGIARVAPTGHETVVKVMARDHDYWPVPWYLRRFQNIGWYEELPADPYAPIMLVSSEFKARFDDQSDRKWIMAGIYPLRPGKFFELYVELELWKDYVATLPRPVD